MVLRMKEIGVLLLLVLMFSGCSQTDTLKKETYCNPIDLNYRFRPEKAEVSYREAADPSVVYFKGKYYLFASKSGGYWSSDNLAEWDFIASTGLPTEDYAPAVIAIGDTLYFAASSTSKRPLFKTTKPDSGVWEIANPEFPFPVWDPAFYQDDDGRLYLYWGCSPKNPLYGIELDLKNQLNPIGQPKIMLDSDTADHGWECPGENNEKDTSPWLEGAWMNKLNGKYYLQYAVPGTEVRTYADGYYVGESPLGPFIYSPYSPFSRRTGGFATGIGHSCTFQDKYDNYWHATTMVISVKHMFERRLCIFPADFDQDGVLFTRTAYGDYPHYIPIKERDLTKQSDFTGWMLLSYNKPTKVSSQLEGYESQQSVDENVRTYWAAEGESDEWLELDLQKRSRINAVQINFAEHETSIYGREQGIYYQYKVEYSKDGKKWQVLLDKSQSKEDTPHAYHQLEEEIAARYLRLSVLKMPDGKVAVSGFRVFGNAFGDLPGTVKGLKVQRNPQDEREVNISWDDVKNAQGYVLRYGIAPDKLYQSVMLYKQNDITLKSLNRGMNYYFAIEAFNESGIAELSDIVVGKSNSITRKEQ
ncbi:family 43 glycosylhydrolase [Sunxiuqinia sp. sy24]|uniref:family 43 glycosylhydrolase n=1 Tax=Sunxiuqinia sp. sy24 TaxID=3461495 RepID=UPI00404613D2